MTAPQQIFMDRDSLIFGADRPSQVTQPTFSISNGRLRLIDRAVGKVTPIVVDLTYTQIKPQQNLLIHAGRFWKGSGTEVMSTFSSRITALPGATAFVHAACRRGDAHDRGSRFDRFAQACLRITSAPSHWISPLAPSSRRALGGFFVPPNKKRLFSPIWIDESLSNEVV
jgi:hypothetical protein